MTEACEAEQQFDDLGKKSRGSPYDSAIKSLDRGGRMLLCEWAGSPVGPRAILGPEELPANTLRVDYLIFAPPKRLIHMEFESRPNKDIGRRVFCYHGRFLERYKDYEIEQHVFLLKGSGIPERWATKDAEVRFRVHVMQEKDPEPLLAHPDTAPFAVLARAGRGERVTLLAQALTTIWESSHVEEYRYALMCAAATLAELHLKPAQIDRAWKESKVPVSFPETRYSRYCRRRLTSEAKAEGKVEGKVEERTALLTALLTDKFGDSKAIAAVVARLGTLSPADAVHAVSAAASLDDLR